MLSSRSAKVTKRANCANASDAMAKLAKRSSRRTRCGTPISYAPPPNTLATIWGSAHPKRPSLELYTTPSSGVRRGSTAQRVSFSCGPHSGPTPFVLFIHHGSLHACEYAQSETAIENGSRALLT